MKSSNGLRITYSDKSKAVIFWRKQTNGLFSTSTRIYGSDGYYKAGSSFDRQDVNPSEIDRLVDASSGFGEIVFI